MPIDGMTFLKSVKTETLPTFRVRWSDRNRIDLRPVAWSLRNRPDEWEWGGILHYRIIHKPSCHEFWVGNGLYHYDLYHADCSCSARKSRPTWSDRCRFHRAFMWWQEQNDPQNPLDHEQFVAHFVTARGDR